MLNAFTLYYGSGVGFFFIIIIDELLFAGTGFISGWPIVLRIASASGIPDAGVAPAFAAFLVSLFAAGEGAAFLTGEVALALAPGAASVGGATGVEDGLDTLAALFAVTELVFALPLAGLLLAGAEPPQPIAIRDAPSAIGINIFLNIYLVFSLLIIAMRVLV